MLRLLALVIMTCITLGAMALHFCLAALSVMGAGAAFIALCTIKGVIALFNKFKGA